MSKFRKLIALLSFIFYLFAGPYNLLAAIDEDEVDTQSYVDSGNDQGGGFYATKPECTSGLTEAIITIITVFIAGKDFIIPGIIDLIIATKTAQVISQGIAIAKISIGVLAIAAVGISMSTSLQCFFSFVRDPIVYKDNDISKGMLKDDGKTITTNRWEAANAPYSPYITVCARPWLSYPTVYFMMDPIPKGLLTIVVPYMLLLSPLMVNMGADGDGDAIINQDSSSCYWKNSNYGVDNKYYDGENAFLCPEEWRYHGYSAEVRSDPKTGKPYKVAIKGNAQDELEEANKQDESDVLKNILHMRRHSGPLICKIKKNGDVFQIHGYQYRILKLGAKLCAKLSGINLPSLHVAPPGGGVATVDLTGGVIPSVGGSFFVGCHYTKPDEPSPLCDKSTKIFMNQKVPDPAKPGAFIEQNVLDDATGEPIVIDYDNSKCFSCFVGEVCHSRTSSHAKSVMPLTSYVMECAHSTLQNVIFGCVDPISGIRPPNAGLLYLANKELVKITYILILLAVVLFGYKILFMNNLPKTGEMVATVLKVGVVLYAIHGTNENNGLHWFYNRVTQLSDGLGALVIRASVATQGMCHFEDNMYATSGGGSSMKRDFSFIRPYDILDCLVFFYLGGAMLGYDQASTLNIGEILANLLPRLIMLAVPLLAMFDPLAFIVGFAFFLFVIMVISLVTWFVSIMLMAMIMMFFLILIAPIVLPLMLFPYTKNMFDNWVKEVIAYTLFPPMLFLFMGLMLAIYNAKIFGETKFTTIEVDVLGRKARHSVFIERNDCDTNTTDALCKSCEKFGVRGEKCDGCDPAALACQIRVLSLKKGRTLWSMSSIESPGKAFLNILESVGYILLMTVIFLTLITTVAFLVAKVVGGSRSLYQIIAHAISPMTVFAKVSKYAFKPAIMTSKKIWDKTFGKLKSAPGGSVGRK